MNEEYYCPEVELYHQINPSCNFGEFCAAFRRMVADFKFFNPELDYLTFSKGLADVMQKNGFWDEKIKEYLQ